MGQLLQHLVPGAEVPSAEDLDMVDVLGDVAGVSLFKAKVHEAYRTHYRLAAPPPLEELLQGVDE